MSKCFEFTGKVIKKNQNWTWLKQAIRKRVNRWDVIKPKSLCLTKCTILCKNGHNGKRYATDLNTEFHSWDGNYLWYFLDDKELETR